MLFMKADEFSKIGSKLVSASKAIDRTPGEVLQELFPYIYEASRRMSARQIAKWLADEYGIQISQPTISRALRNPEAFDEWFTENIEPTARRIASSLGMPITELLLDTTAEADLELHERREHAKESLSEAELKEVEEGLAFLANKWFSLSAGTRRACFPVQTPEDWKQERGNDGN